MLERSILLAPLAGLLCALASCSPVSEPAAPDAGQPQAAAAPAPAPKGGKGRKPRTYEYDSVPANRELELPEGFRGDVHPELAPEARLELVARWKPTLPEAKRKGLKLGIIDNQESPEYALPDELVALLTESRPAAERASYGARELSVLLPATVEEAGQMWRIDPAAAARFLAQIHPATATDFTRYDQPYGRRPGPAGAFGILRAVTPELLDVVFRVHAEFVLKKGAIVYTPACFLGRMLVDRARDAVVYLEMHVPTDLSVNLNVLLTFPLPDDPRKEVTNIVFERVEILGLVGGDAAALARVPSEGALDPQVAHDRLKRAFYKFLDIAWVPPEEVVATAARVQRPILMAVLTSPLDDQSC
ncbi:MAG TPA: hypothetical protein VF530_04040 [Planctomycetota bacterium]